MYRINDKASIIMYIQNYLRVVGNRDIFVAPSGIYDENTRLSVLDFQKRFSLPETGIVDKITLETLFNEYVRVKRNSSLIDIRDFPIKPGIMSEQIRIINDTISKLVMYYGYTHNIKRNSNYYSKETINAIHTLRSIYLLDKQDYIDEELYFMMITDLNTIEENNNLKRFTE